MKTNASLALMFCLCFSLGCGPSAETGKTGQDTEGTTASNLQEGEVLSESNAETATIPIADQIVEASCGQCQFKMEGSGCDLAVRIDGKTYYVDGSNIDDHGDAHGDDGLCNCIRKAKVSGEINNGRFVASSFEVFPLDD